MGAWGDQPWDNDAAADFFAELFPPDFHDRVMAALSAEADEEEWRAAAWVVYTLAQSPYVWPGDPKNMAEACRAAADRLEQLAEYHSEPAETPKLRQQAVELRGRSTAGNVQ